MSDLRVDPARMEQGDELTGIYVRAIGPDDRWGSFDIAQLDRASFVEFVTSRGPVSEWALSILLAILGHPRS